jgi:hypothetical protein
MVSDVLNIQGILFFYVNTLATGPFIRQHDSHHLPVAMKAGFNLGERRYSSYSFFTSALDGVRVQRHAPAALCPRGKDHRYPLYRRLGGPQSQSGQRG